MGYLRLATFLSSDSSFMQNRGFGSLHSGMLLAQRYDIEVLERELDTIDKWDENEGDHGTLGCKERDDLHNCMEKYSQTSPMLERDRTY